MLRKLVYLGVFAGVSASLPIVYEVNPEAFLRYADSWANEAETPAAGPVSAGPVQIRMAPAEPELLGRKVRVEPDARGHFSTEFKLNGRRIDAMIDTGATLVALNVSTARKIGIKLEPADFKYTVDTANGEARAATATIGELQVGKIILQNIDAVVLDDKALSGTLIGMSFLKRLDKYEVTNGSLLLVQ